MNYIDGRTNKEYYCINCNKQLSKSAYKGTKRCHSCEGKRRFKIGILNSKGKNNPHWRGGLPKCVDCEITISYAAKRCKSCARKYQYTTRPETHPMLGKKGNLNPNWNNGSSKFPYPFEFTKELKVKIFKRDNYTCKKCGIYPSNDLTVHHIDYNKENCEEKNLMTLCRGCNTSVNFDKDYWYIYFRYLMENYINEQFSN